MKVEWSDERCIVCLRKPQAENPGSYHNKAHVLLESIGGRLWSEFLCIDCNGRMGVIEEKLLGDVSVIELVRGLGDRLPRTLALGIISRARYYSDHPEHGRLYFAQSRETGKVEAEVTAKTRRERDVRRDIEKKLRNRGATAEELFDRLAAYEGIAPGGEFEVVPGYVVLKPLDLTGEVVMRTLDEPVVPDVVPLGFAYLFLACCIQDAVYAPELDAARAALRSALGGDESSANGWPIEKLRSTADPAPLHGLAFEENNAEAVVRIVLFRWLQWRVRFPGIAAPEGRMYYSRDLASGEWSPTRICPDWLGPSQVTPESPCPVSGNSAGEITPYRRLAANSRAYRRIRVLCAHLS